MPLPKPSPWQYLGGLVLWFLAYGMAVGSGFELHVEHDHKRLWALAVAAMMALAGTALLWLALRSDRR
jgi:ammonia channel protein AmtB